MPFSYVHLSLMPPSSSRFHHVHYTRSSVCLTRYLFCSNPQATEVILLRTASSSTRAVCTLAAGATRQPSVALMLTTATSECVLAAMATTETAIAAVSQDASTIMAGAMPTQRAMPV